MISFDWFLLINFIPLSLSTVGPSSRQDYGGGADPLIPEEESESTEAPLPGIIGRAREGLQRFRENANDFWDGIRDRVSDWFDTD